MLECFDIDWPNILKLDEKNVNSVTNNFLDTVNSVLNKYVPLKKVNKYKLTLKNPWITSGIQKSIYIKIKLLKKFINRKYPQIKAVFHEQYLLFIISKFIIQISLKIIEITLKILGKESKLWFQLKISQLQCFFQLSLITEPIQTLQLWVNVLNNYFTSIAKKTNPNIKFLSKHHTDYLSYRNTNSFFSTPTDQKEIYFIISSLYSHKSSGPNSIPVKILKLLK